MKQTTFPALAWDGRKKVTQRERFWGEMEAVIPWDRLVVLIEPHYLKGANGRLPMALRTEQETGIDQNRKAANQCAEQARYALSAVSSYHSHT